MRTFATALLVVAASLAGTASAQAYSPRGQDLANYLAGKTCEGNLRTPNKDVYFMEGGILKVHHYAEDNYRIDRGVAEVTDGSSDNPLMYKYPKLPGESQSGGPYHIYQIKPAASGVHVQTPFANGDYVCRPSK